MNSPQQSHYYTDLRRDKYCFLDWMTILFSQSKHLDVKTFHLNLTDLQRSCQNTRVLVNRVPVFRDRWTLHQCGMFREPYCIFLPLPSILTLPGCLLRLLVSYRFSDFSHPCEPGSCEVARKVFCRTSFQLGWSDIFLLVKVVVAGAGQVVVLIWVKNTTKVKGSTF